FFSSRRRHTRSKRDWSSDVCSSDLTFSAGRKEAFELVVLPALGDGLFGAAVLGLFLRDALQDGLHIVGREDGNILHCADDLELVDGAALVDVGRIADGRSFIEVDLYSRAGLVGQDRPAAIVAAAFLPFPYSPIRPGHIMDVTGVQAGFIISAIGERVFAGLGLFEGQ